MSDNSHIRVYCAGPLFNYSERNEMTQIADGLHDAGFAVYLPHRDGMEFRLVLRELLERDWDKEVAAHFLHQAIFALDIYQLVSACNAVVWNLNGRVPDEGAVSEAAIAWTLGHPIVAYADDARSLIEGRINPLLVGLVDFKTTDEISRIPQLLHDELTANHRTPCDISALPPAVQTAVNQGAELWKALQTGDNHANNEAIASVVTDLFAPTQVSTGGN